MKKKEIGELLKEYGVRESFSRGVIRQAQSIPDHVTGDQCRGREDLRDKLTVTIDGADARDLDDAITLEKNGERYVLGVHIADVSAYVAEGSPLDRSALSRGTSIYLTDKVIPMLPRELSNGICSLNQWEDRLALSCIMDLDGRGTVRDYRIVETLIRVDLRMTYDGVQAILEGKGHPEGSREDIRRLCFRMRDLAGLLKDKRRKRGAVDFDFPESQIITDKDGRVCDIRPYERNTATDIIEDFMLLANETVAQDYFWQEIPFIYRVHEAPEPDRLKKFDLFIRNFGYYLRTERETFHPKEIQKLLFSLEGEPEEALISRLALRAMQRAIYSTVNAGHFGLSTKYYTHFTSPIRRYPDLQIHRIIKENLHAQLTEDRLMHYEEILPEVARKCSALERRAQEVEREEEKLEKIEFMQNRIGEHFTGLISGVIASGFFVELPNTVEGMVPVRSLTDDYYIFDQENYCLTGERTGRIFTLGQEVEIIVKSTDKVRKTIDFCLEEFYPGEVSFHEEDDYSPVDGEEDFPDDGAEELSYDDRTGIAVNDWLSDEEAERLLKLYSAKK